MKHALQHHQCNFAVQIQGYAKKDFVLHEVVRTKK